MVLRNCNRLLRLINQILDISKLESGKMVLQASPHNIVPLTRWLVMALESRASLKNISLSFNSIDDRIMVYLEQAHYEK